jgi:Na+-transporting methylmalonyl-CoA/oxaloacetate decarboxylase gamma subunit
MKNFKKIAIFIVVTLVIFSVLPITVFAEAASTTTDGAVDSGKLDMNLKPETFEERLEYALQGTATGMIMVFAVLGLLCLILYGSKFVFYDIPNKKREKAIKVKQESLANAPQPAVEVTQSVSETVAPAPVAQDDGELAAVITAAIAAMLESEEYKNEFVGGFRVVSFKRSTQGAWNRK